MLAVTVRSAVVVAALSGIAVRAHHSIAAVYDGSRRVTIDVVVEEFHFVSPHPFVLARAGLDRDPQRHWRLELDNRFELAAVGITSDTLRKGDRLVITGAPARDGSSALYVRRLDRPSDGFWYEQVGSSPRTSLRR